MAGMPRLLAVARRPLAASLYRVVHPVTGRLPAPATSTPVRDLVPRCSLPLSHGWETRVAVRAFSSSSGEGGGGRGSSGPGGEAGAAQGREEARNVKEQGRTRRRSRAKTSSSTSPPATSSEEERRCTYLHAEDPGLRNLGGSSLSAASGVRKDTVASMDTEGAYTAAASAIGEVSASAPFMNTDAPMDTDGVNAGAASGIVSVPSMKTDASDGLLNMGVPSGVGKDTSSGVNTEAENAIGKDSMVAMNTGAGNDADKVSVAGAMETDASDCCVVADAASVLCKPASARGGTDAAGDVGKDAAYDTGTNAAYDTGTNAAAGVANEAGHGVDGTDAPSRKRGVRRTRAKAAAAVPEKPATDVEKNAAPGKGGGQDHLAGAKNSGRVGEEKKKASPGKGSSGRVTGEEKKKASPGKGSSGRVTGEEKKKASPGKGSSDGTAPGSVAEASSNPRGKSDTNAGAGSQHGEQKKKKAGVTLAKYLHAMENRIEKGFFQTRVHLEHKMSWLLSSFDAMLQKHMTKLKEEMQVASIKLQLKQTKLLFLGGFLNLLGVVGACAYAGYRYGWPFIEEKIFNIPYDDRAKTAALEAFKGGLRYVLAKITFQEARDELRNKLPVWLGGRKEEEEKVTRSRWWRDWPWNWWRNKAEEKKEEERKRKGEEDKRRKEEEDKKKKEEYSSWWLLWPGNWGRSKVEVKKEGEEEKEYLRLWFLWPGYWWLLWPGNWGRSKVGKKKEEGG